MDWREKLFGKVLVKCDSPGTKNGQFENVPTLEALKDCVEEGDGPVCGIYFSFANISDASDDFGVRLEELYHKVHPRLKVVQVVLWAHVGTPEGPIEREAGFKKSLTGKPWFAVPFHNVDTKRRLTQKYSIAVGVPTLVIRGRAVRDALLSDVTGAQFPWPAPPLQEVLRGVPLQFQDETRLYEELPQDAIRVFYFAAHWCPPCRAFTPSLCAALSAVKKRRSKYANTQLILVSSDRSEQSYNRTVQSVSSVGAISIPWSASEARQSLPAALGVGGIPALVITDGSGKVLTGNGRQSLAADPLGLDTNGVDNLPHTFKNYYFEEDSEDGDLIIPMNQEGLKRTRSSTSLDEFFDLSKAKKKQKKTSSTVGRAQKAGGISYISTNADDASKSTHLIKIEIYDLKKLAKVPANEHWKYADLRTKYYTQEKDEIFNHSKELLYKITKDVASSKDCKKYFFNN